MLQKLPIALAQVKPGNTSVNILNEIRQIIYFLYREKEVPKKVYSNIMNSIKLSNRIDNTFLNSKNSDPHRLFLNLKDETILNKIDKYVALSNLSIYYTWENIKKVHTELINLKYQLWHGMTSLNYLIDQILYQIFRIILNISLKKHGEKTD